MSDSEAPAKKGWFGRLKEGLSRTATNLTQSVTGLFTKRKLDAEALEELEEALIRADLGHVIAGRVVAELRRTRFDKEVTQEEIRTALAGVIAPVLKPVQQPLDFTAKPHVVLVVGVNGVGKTTTIGKIAQNLVRDGKHVVMAAGDTFRAAAIEQLTIWGQRTGSTVVSGKVGGDAAGLAFEALQKAKAENADVLLVDTAGRLQNKAHLMDELAKIIRVIKKLDPSAPHSTLLILDATTGQNAINQVEVFRSIANVSGLVVTKLDGTARGGVLVAIAEQFGLPVHWIGVGETADDLQPFDAEAFSRALTGDPASAA
jgi:fused signal recognition particle receptor